MFGLAAAPEIAIAVPSDPAAGRVFGGRANSTIGLPHAARWR